MKFVIMLLLSEILCGVSIMPIRRRRVARKPKRRAPMKKRVARKGRGSNRTTDYAKCVEIQETQLVAVADAAGENVGAAMNFCLADYQRPQEIAHAYKYYRASNVEITFIPYYNFAATGGLPNLRLPQLYMSVDRLSNRWIAPNETECLERGISPKVFNRKCKLTFKPNLLQEIALETRQPADGGGVPQGIDLAGFLNSTALFNKWLPTQQSYGYNVAPPANQVNQVLAPGGVNPYALRYHGAIYCASIEGQAPGTNFIVGDIQLKVTWEFKGPRALKSLPPQPEPNPVVVTSSQGNPGATPNTQQTTYP